MLATDTDPARTTGLSGCTNPSGLIEADEPEYGGGRSGRNRPSRVARLVACRSELEMYPYKRVKRTSMSENSVINLDPKPYLWQIVFLIAVA